MENLLAASSQPALEVAALEWQLKDVQRRPGVRLHCQLCNTPIDIAVLIESRLNGVVLIIGKDCFAKLVRFLETQRIESPLRRPPARQEVRGRLHALERELGDATSSTTARSAALHLDTVLGWFQMELDAGQLPPSLAMTIRTITNLGVTATLSSTDELVAYYKANRRFPTSILVRVPARVPLGFQIPSETTIDGALRIRALLERLSALADARRDRRERVLRERAVSMHTAAAVRLTELKGEVGQLAEAVTRELPVLTDRVAKALAKLWPRVASLEREQPSIQHEFVVQDLVRFADELQQSLASPTVRAFIDPRPLPAIAFVEGANGWRQLTVFRTPDGTQPEQAGCYTARLLPLDELAITGTAELPAGECATVDLTIGEAEHLLGARVRGYVGKIGEVWTVPVPKPLWRPGTYRCLVIRRGADRIDVHPLEQLRDPRGVYTPSRRRRQR